jgi:hypothetical protein
VKRFAIIAGCVLLIAALVTLASRSWWETPELSGTLTAGNRWASGFAVRIAASGADSSVCDPPLRSAITDSLGSFRLPGVVVHAWRPVRLGRRPVAWNLCVARPAAAAGSRWQAICHYAGEPLFRVMLLCDLSRSSPAAVCRVVGGG